MVEAITGLCVVCNGVVFVLNPVVSVMLLTCFTSELTIEVLR